MLFPYKAMNAVTTYVDLIKFLEHLAWFRRTSTTFFLCEKKIDKFSSQAIVSMQIAAIVACKKRWRKMTSSMFRNEMDFIVKLIMKLFSRRRLAGIQKLFVNATKFFFSRASGGCHCVGNKNTLDNLKRWFYDEATHKAMSGELMPLMCRKLLCMRLRFYDSRLKRWWKVGLCSCGCCCCCNWIIM